MGFIPIQVRYAKESVAGLLVLVHHKKRITLLSVKVKAFGSGWLLPVNMNAMQCRGRITRHTSSVEKFVTKATKLDARA
jgi:hypothetical protein